MTNVKVLDCTLRDGGYYNEWDFPPAMAADVVSALDAAGVDIIELGYKSRGANGFYGLFKYCDDGLLARILPKRTRAELAVMIDAKEFAIDNARGDVAALRAVMRPAKDSVFSWVRIATHPASVPASLQLATALKEWGYRVALNVMGISMLERAALQSVLRDVGPTSVDVVYLADSYGSLTPQQTLEKIAAIRSVYAGPIGVHMHENQGLALANTLAAIDDGVAFVDATLAGMGRGAGNLKLEQLLPSLFFRYGRHELAPSALLPVLAKHLAPLHEKFAWGWDFNYMLSGLIGIHPTYCQELKTGSRYAMDDVAAILERIPADKRAKFDEAQLMRAATEHMEQKRTAAGEVAVSAVHTVKASDTVLVVANGPSAATHKDALRELIAREQPLVIECNDVAALDGIERLTVVMNQPRMDEVARRNPNDAARSIVTPLASVPASLRDRSRARVRYALEHAAFRVGDDEIVVPAYVVGMLAIGLALRSRPKQIWLAGFDGFDDARRAEQAEMETFFELLRRSDHAAGVSVTSLLRTTYNVPVRSIYSYLQP